MSTAWQTIVSFANLCRAAKNAVRGKRSVQGAARFLAQLEPEVLQLQRALVTGLWQPGRPVTFDIRDPKVRTITAAPFRDRVVHHALIDVLEPGLDAALLPCTFACRRGYGQHRALQHAQRLVRRHGWFSKLDVAKFFRRCVMTSCWMRCGRRSSSRRCSDCANASCALAGSAAAGCRSAT